MHDHAYLSEKCGAVSKNAQASHSDLSRLSAVSLRPEVFDPVIGRAYGIAHRPTLASRDELVRS